MRDSIQIIIVNKKTGEPIYIDDYEDPEQTLDILIDLLDAGIVKAEENELITDEPDDVQKYFKIKWNNRGKIYSKEELSAIEAKVRSLIQAGLLAALEE